MRSKHSIKFRVTLWYASFMVVMVLILFGALGYTSHKMIENDIKDALKHTVVYNLPDIEIIDGELVIDHDTVHTQNGVSVLVYGENNFIISGNLPENVTNEIPFIDKDVRLIEDGGNKFYVYDRLINEPDYADVWVRGIISANMADIDSVLTFMTKALLIWLPLLILLTCIGGYRITKKAFKPVGQIAATISGIEAGGDLSKRIGLDADRRTKDEIYQLSSTFDNMLERLESSFEAEKRFSNDASHELRTPLSVIMAQCEYALKNTDNVDDAKESLEIIYGQSQKMSSIINNLLMIARSESGILKLHIEDINASELTELVAIEHHIMASEKGISIQMDIQPNIIAQLDESMFIRIWTNLISNGIKYGKENGYVKIMLTQDGNNLIGSVTDNGIGIAEENIPKVWSRFYQVNPSRSDDGGVGLGLSMVGRIIAEHGGSIKTSSKLGVGTKFTFTLPLKQPINKQ